MTLRLFVIFFSSIFFFNFCSKVSESNACDSTNPGFKEILILKYLIGEYSKHCGISLFGGRTLYFQPSDGYYTSPQELSIYSKISETSIFFTIDNSYPSESSYKYSEPFPIWSAAGQKFNVIGRKDGIQNSLNLQGLFSYQPLKTAQNIPYATGDDGDLQIGIPFDSFSPTSSPAYPNDFISKDRVTGLIWKSCSEGQTGQTCAGGTLQSINLDTSISSCESLNVANSSQGFAGLKNWRLPTMKELLTLNDASKSSLTINTTAFPNSANFAYWSITIYPTNLGFGWYLDLSTGNTYATFRTNLYHARCVSSPKFSEATNFQDNADGTIQDRTTGLFWEKCQKGMTYNNSCIGTPSPDTWSNALSYCSNLTLAGKKWRLPNRTELVSLMDFSKTGSRPTINDVFESGSSSGLYWTSTSYTPTTPASNAWYVNFGTAINSLYDFNSKVTPNYIRCTSSP